MNVLQANLIYNPEKHINYQFKRANLLKNTLENRVRNTFNALSKNQGPPNFRLGALRSLSLQVIIAQPAKIIVYLCPYAAWNSPF